MEIVTLRLGFDPKSRHRTQETNQPTWSHQQVGRCESIRLFKRVVTSSKSGLWDEVAVTQIRSLTSPYLRALWPPPKMWKIANFLFSSELLLIESTITSRCPA
ncbi:hypothetical protein ALC56_04855 [Trachymyrmex septentrionalis]|uniref:Uncharacterized protein n=1 Tax=Trachymyrmex septentrionalis TaxID=34720 RepID=A0A195FJK4_9HYME|nr:hypothetical protein ALC56_04855 [Trachymyrmex septentrionalis]